MFMMILLKQHRFKKDLDISKLKLQEEEVAEVKWLNYADFKNLFYSDKFVPFNDEYKKFVLDLFDNTFKLKQIW